MIKTKSIKTSIHIFLGILFGLLALSLAAGGAAACFLFYSNKPPASQRGGAAQFAVIEGENAGDVGRRLEQEGLIRNRHFWFLLNKAKKDYLKAGLYLIQLPASQTQIRELFVSGRQLLSRITIPEGLTLRKMARFFDDAGVCSAADFLAAANSEEILAAYGINAPSMEGYLYPDTYFFQTNYPAVKVVETLADNFFEKLASIAGEDIDRKTLHEKLILASIVEREYRVDEEAALMASVFYNRLKIRMPLQSCATIEYIITEIQGKPHPAVLYDRDLEIRNPYNTYLHRGLPPGPISAPGAVALSAAFKPEESAYFYFRLIDPSSGRHYFSKTFNDHIRHSAGVYVVKD